MPRKPTARIFRGTSRNLSYLARCLRDGDIVGVPTETVYGLAADALNPRACQKIFTAKGRPTTDPLIVHIAALDELDAIAVTNTAALRLAQKFWPGPLTLILPKKSVVPAIVSAGLPSVAVRMPAHALFRRLIRLSGRPLAAPSANPFGYISPTTAEHVRASLGSKINSILDGGPAHIGLESTILDLRDPARPRPARSRAAGAATGVILTAGTYDGQELTLFNNSANSITFAAVGTSNVANGTSAVIAANTGMTLVWSVSDLKWYVV
jgi:L-threonylcarbamoyladenylate synthase